MKIFNEIEIQKAAEEWTESLHFSHKSMETSTMAKRLDKSFIAGAAYAESKIEDVCIEFANWINNHKEGFHSMYKDKNDKNTFWGSSYTGGRIDYTSKELFEMFLKQRNDKIITTK